MKILVTGGAGYIGSTVASACVDAGHIPIILDDLSAGRPEFARGREFYEGDICEYATLDRLFSDHPDIRTVVHCAAKIVVPESVARPLAYYDVNVGRTVNLLNYLQRTKVTGFIFSSSASIYAPCRHFAVDEESAIGPQSPYAMTKVIVESILRDVSAASGLRVISLRYFNPIGADPALRTGQQIAEPSHLMGKLLEASSRTEPFVVTGTDWPTRDGSGIRDFIHVWDLARAHVAAIDHLDAATAANPFEAINVGTGRGTTVREMVDAFIRASSSDMTVVDGPRRPGDTAGVYARTEKAYRLLNWRAELSDSDGIEDSLRWLRQRESVLGY